MSLYVALCRVLAKNNIQTKHRISKSSCISNETIRRGSVIYNINGKSSDKATTTLNQPRMECIKGIFFLI